jgi:hypothetical protein
MINAKTKAITKLPIAPLIISIINNVTGYLD